MPTATITSKGQVTIPQEVRGRHRLHPGTRIDFREDRDGGLRVVRVTRSVEEVGGLLHRPGLGRLSDEETRRRLAAAMKKKWCP